MHPVHRSIRNYANNVSVSLQAITIESDRQPNAKQPTRKHTEVERVLSRKFNKLNLIHDQIAM